jgi:predicted nucleic acid-binding protein
MYLLDTNVVSELRKSHRTSADRHVVNWARGIAVEDLYLSAITVEELEIGILRLERRDAAQGAMLRSWMNDLVLRAFEGSILPVDSTVARQSAKLHVPDPRPVRDAFIAATALTHGMTVVTRNAADFEPTGVLVFNPWQA